MGKMVRIGRFFLHFELAKELFWTDRKQGGRLYHLINIGVYDMPQISEGCGSFSMSILFVSFKFGWAPKR